MNKFITLTAPALAASLAIASASKAVNVDQGHYELGLAVVSTGIELKINPEACFVKDASFGWYWAARNELVVCQQNATQPGVEVRWTAEDFDTLRHEAHHLTQDCLDGSTDGDIQNIYKDSPAFVTGVLSQRKIKTIIKAYIDRGADTVRTELEAFAVASLNDPLE